MSCIVISIATKKEKSFSSDEFLTPKVCINCNVLLLYHMDLIARNSVFKGSKTVIHKPDCADPKTSWIIAMRLVVRLDMILSSKQITKVLIRLRRCAGWSAPLLFANHRGQIFQRHSPNHGRVSYHII